ncbi:hypothetical protein J2TS4_48970 [Paenibacillus sp. J2TS4]|nr:hypothetical protein J2TS4_48970 [Paenibacillus sp. J2TS4]
MIPPLFIPDFPHTIVVSLQNANDMQKYMLFRENRVNNEEDMQKYTSFSVKSRKSAKGLDLPAQSYVINSF